MLLRSVRKEVILDINEWQRDSFGSTAEISLLICKVLLIYFSFVLFDMPSTEGFVQIIVDVMSFLVLTFFLYVTGGIF